MTHGAIQSDQSTSTLENVAATESGEPAQTIIMNVDSSTDTGTQTREERERVLERVEREMDFFRKGEYTQFQASTRVVNELHKWEGASDKKKGKAFDTYLAEINSLTAIQDEERSNAGGTSLPAHSSNLTGDRPTKRIRDEVETSA